MGKKSKKQKQKQISEVSGPSPKTQMERMGVVQEISCKINEHRLENEIASKILDKVLENYVLQGTKYINKEIKLSLRGDIERKFVINLFNDKYITDTVLIKAIQPKEI